MKKSEALFGVLRVPLDAVAVFAALVISFRLRQADVDLLPGFQLLERATTLPPFDYYVSTFVLPGVVLFVVVSAFLGLYSLKITFGAWAEIGREFASTLLWLALVNAWFFLVLKELFFSRILLLHSVFFIFLFVVVFHALLKLLQRALLKRGIGKISVVSVGAQDLAPAAHDTLTHDTHYAYLGHVTSLEFVKRLSVPVDLVVQTDPNPQGEDTLALIDYCRSHHIGYGFLPPVLADVPHLLDVDRLGLLPFIRFQPTTLDGWGRVVKRVFDIVVSAVAIIVLAPVILLLAIFVVIDSGFPVFYVSTRVGQLGRRTIHTLKFRSMRRNADAEKPQLEELNHRTDGPLFKIKNDPRVTRFGKFLRRWSLDEWPQLFNVLIGEMSLVGPRPHLPDEVERYTQEQRRVFAVKPGITGLAQVSGRSDLNFSEEMKLDLRYIEEWSILLDLWILWRTVFTVLSRKGAD